MTIEHRERNIVRYVFALVPYGNTVREIQFYRRNLFAAGIVSARAWPVMLPLHSCMKAAPVKAAGFPHGSSAPARPGACLAGIATVVGATWEGFRDLEIRETGGAVVISSRRRTTQLPGPVDEICRSAGFGSDCGDFPLPAGVFYVCRTVDIGGRALSSIPPVPRSAEFLDCRTALYRFRFRPGEPEGASWTIRYGPALRTGKAARGAENPG